MIAVTGKSLSEIVKDIEDQYGETHMEERSYRFTAEEKARIQKVLLEEQKLPELPLRYPVFLIRTAARSTLKWRLGKRQIFRYRAVTSYLL